MIWSFITDVVGNALGIGRDYLASKRREAEARSKTLLAIEEAKAKSAIKVAETGQLADIQWDAIAQQNAGASWKDEWLTILVSIPIIMCFIPGLDKYATRGFEILGQTPDWFRYTFGLIVAASFGVKKAAEIISGRKP